MILVTTLILKTKEVLKKELSLIEIWEIIWKRVIGIIQKDGERPFNHKIKTLSFQKAQDHSVLIKNSVSIILWIKLQHISKLVKWAIVIQQLLKVSSKITLKTDSHYLKPIEWKIIKKWIILNSEDSQKQWWLQHGVILARDIILQHKTSLFHEWAQAAQLEKFQFATTQVLLQNDSYQQTTLQIHILWKE